MIREWGRNTFGALGLRDYLVLSIGTQFAFLGFQMSAAAQSVVAFDLEGTNSAVGIVFTGQGIAMLFVAPYGGVIADRISKRLLLLVGQGAVGAVFLATGLLIIADLMNVWLLALSALVMGLAFAFIGPARQAYVSELVPREILGNAVALSQLMVTTGRIAGPVLASVLIGIAFIGTGGTYLIMAALYVAVIATLIQLPPSGGMATERRSVLSDLRDGARHIWQNPRLRVIVWSFMATVLVAWPHQALLPALLENELDEPASQVGVLMGVSAAAGIVVGLVVTGLVGGSRAWLMMLALGMVFGVGLILLGLAPGYGVALLTMLVVGAGFMGFRLMNNALLLTEADQAYHGRVMAIVMMGFGAQGLASLPVAVLADAIGERTVLIGEGVGTIAIALAAVVAYLRTGEAPAAAATPSLSEAKHTAPADLGGATD